MTTASGRLLGAAAPGRPRTLFRCDASAAMGGGHVMRCLTLADALARRGWWCGFAVGPDAAATVPRLRHGAFDVLLLDGPAAAEPQKIAHWLGGRADLLVADHYGRDAAFESACRSWAERILVIDDLANRRHDADILIDPTCGRAADAYSALVPQRCRLLAGAGFALLRPAFTEARPASLERRRSTACVDRLLVAFGATDPDNATARALTSLAEARLPVEIDVVLGAGAPHLAAVRAQASEMPQPTRVHADPENLASLMAAADLAIGAGGGMALERCCLGLPSIVIEIAGNQQLVARALAVEGAVLNLGPARLLSRNGLAMVLRAVAFDRNRLALMSAAASRLCDGEGLARAVAAVEALALGDARAACDASPRPEPCPSEVTSRPATLADAHRMFVWQTDSTTRRYSFHPEPPAWDAHVRWLQTRLADPGCLFHVVLADGEPAGVVRLERRCVAGLREACEVSIAVASEFRGRGVGATALALARALAPDVPLVARVKPENEPSLRLFAAAGYQPFAEGVFVNWPHAERSGVHPRQEVGCAG